MAAIPCSSLEAPVICLLCGKDAIAHDRRILQFSNSAAKEAALQAAIIKHVLI